MTNFSGGHANIHVVSLLWNIFDMAYAEYSRNARYISNLFFKQAGSRFKRKNLSTQRVTDMCYVIIYQISLLIVFANDLGYDFRQLPCETVVSE